MIQQILAVAILTAAQTPPRHSPQKKIYFYNCYV